MRSTSNALVNAIIEEFGSVRKPKYSRPDSAESDAASTELIASRFIDRSAVLRRRRAAHVHQTAQAREQWRACHPRRAAEALRDAVQNDCEHHHRKTAFESK